MRIYFQPKFVYAGYHLLNTEPLEIHSLLNNILFYLCLKFPKYRYALAGLTNVVWHVKSVCIAFEMLAHIVYTQCLRDYCAITKSSQ